MVLELVFPASDLLKMELEESLGLCPRPLGLPGQDFLETISEAHCERFAAKEADDETGTMRKGCQGLRTTEGRERARVEPTWREGTSPKREQTLICWLGMRDPGVADGLSGSSVYLADIIRRILFL